MEVMSMIWTDRQDFGFDGWRVLIRKLLNLHEVFLGKICDELNSRRLMNRFQIIL